MDGFSIQKVTESIEKRLITKLVTPYPNDLFSFFLIRESPRLICLS